MTNPQKARFSGLRRTAFAAAAAALCAGFCTSASAVELNTGNESVQIRLDNTLRYNFGKRVEAQSAAILGPTPGAGMVNSDDGDRNFAKGSTVTNRIDVLTEFDVIFEKKFGVRASAASWYDRAYARSFDNTSLATSNHLDASGNPAFGLSDFAKRYYKGTSGEWLDAFVFGGFDLGDMPVTFRAGRHTVNWGEGLLLGGAVHGIGYSQAPLDIGKAYSTPGTEAKELFRPLAQLSGSIQATPELSFSGQYFFKWEASRFPESGTYLGFSDAHLDGGQSLISSTALPFSIGRGYRGQDITPKNRGDWGLAARWSPESLEGTIGFYARNFSDKLPQTIVLVAPTGLPAPLSLLPSKYFFNYAGDIELYGASLAKQIAGVSVGVDLNYRRNMPLVDTGVVLASAAALPAPGETAGARGTTFHGVFNALGSLGATPLWQSAIWAAELSYNRWLSVTQGEAVFAGRDSYVGINKVTKDFVGLAVNFTPTWYQVFPGADVSAPLSYSVGLKGNSAVAFGGNKGAGSYSAGLGLDLYSKYRIDLRYVDYFADYVAQPNGVIKTANGTGALLQDRGAVYLTFKTTF